MFTDRTAAGIRLAAELQHLKGADLVVLGLPRGGVPVAYEVANNLEAPLDIILVRKLGLPVQPELAMGAIGESGVRVLNEEVLAAAAVSDDDIEDVEHRERSELRRRADRYRSGRERIPLQGRVAVVVDDGIATGSTARAACQIARLEGAARVILAVPVAPPGWTDRLEGVADELIAVETPVGFMAIGQFYKDFHQVSDEDVVAILHRARSTTATCTGKNEERDVDLTLGRLRLKGHLRIPPGATGVVLFAH
ncbi:MAG: phosphoribosyltransferase, partial [Acidimicrobiia bacterium]|nr:phosphoribosyltransferase [Acidimicrobiia bacterium]